MLTLAKILLKDFSKLKRKKNLNAVLPTVSYVHKKKIQHIENVYLDFYYQIR